MFSSRNFTASGLKFKSLIHFLCMVYDNGKIIYFAGGYPILSTPFVKETIFSPIFYFIITLFMQWSLISDE